MVFLGLTTLALAYSSLSRGTEPESPVLCPLVVNVEQTLLLPAGRKGPTGLTIDLVPMGDIPKSTHPDKILTPWKPQVILQMPDPQLATLYCFPKSTEVVSLPLTGITLPRFDYPTPNIGIKQVGEWVIVSGS
jgi:hypothetical protein